MNDNSAYEKEILNNIKDIEIALRYYIDKNKELESGLEYYKNAYENRVDEFIQRNKNLEQIEQEHKEENGRLREKLEKKDKIIYNLAFALADYVMYYEYDKCRNPEMIKNKAKEQIEYFTNKVEEDK